MPCNIVEAIASAFKKFQGCAANPSNEIKPGPSNKLKVAVLGGGAAGVSAAFRLSDPALQKNCDVTLYQIGWRLGGKCASGRDMRTSARIKEHGLHMLMGCYQYAFYAIKACFAEWKPAEGSPWKCWTDAFAAHYEVILMEEDSATSPSGWAPWQFPMPQRDGEPGEPDPNGTGPAVPSFCRLLVPYVRTVATFIFANLPLDRAKARPDLDGGLHIDVDMSFKQVFELLESERYEDAFKIIQSIDEYIRSAYDSKEDRFFILTNLGLCTIAGAMWDVCRFGAPGLDSLNSLEFRAWLRRWNVVEIALDSAPLRVLYDLMFAYADGNSSPQPGAPRLRNGDVAAGVALRFVFEAVAGYKKAPLWKMNAGMGDTVFTPFYQVLKQRKVDIKLFHRVTGISLSDDKRRVQAIELDQQAKPVAAEYWPFERVRGLDCWPDEPRWGELENGDNMATAGVNFELAADTTSVARLRLELGKHFDAVVLALPPEVVKVVAGELRDNNYRWARALQDSRSIVTEAFQVWLREPLSNLGGLPGAVVSSFEPTFSSWADMSHLLVRETWPDPPKGLAYACGCLQVAQGSKHDPAKDVDDWMMSHLWKLWPYVGKGKTIDPKLVVARYQRINDDISGRYVQTPHGTVEHRLSPDDVHFENLFVAGDWTRTRFSGGCVESAFESGTRAADAVRAKLSVAATGDAPTYR